uniref:RNase H type-1 domain-containing protein n=1 Tax=Rhizophagus irregularis (strain DAOM 181602 / DAOM 197198 / MUCL 43194) TaxID=747089 RepID=U9STS8_RHIID
MTPKAFKAYFPILRIRGPGYAPFWYKDIQRQTTIPDSNNRLIDEYIITLLANDTSTCELEPCLSSPPTTKNWIVTLDDHGSPIFGKQLLVQASRGTCSIVHWVSPDCESSPGDLIKLSPYPGCAEHTPLLSSKRHNADLTLYILSFFLPPTNGLDVILLKLDIPDFSPIDAFEAPIIPTTIESLAAAVFANSPLVLSSDSRYIFFTDGSLINLGTPDVSMGWSWMQIVPDAGFPNSIATYAHGLIRDNPSSSRAEAAAIYAVLTISPRDSEVTNSQ